MHSLGLFVIICYVSFSLFLIVEVLNLVQLLSQMYALIFISLIYGLNCLLLMLICTSLFSYWFSWERTRHLCQLRRRYVQLYSTLLQQAPNVDIFEIREIEKILDTKVIILWRCVTAICLRVQLFSLVVCLSYSYPSTVPYSQVVGTCQG